MKPIRYLALGLLVIGVASVLTAQDTVSSAGSQNYSTCLNGYYGCDSRQLTSSEQAAVADAAHRRNYNECLYGLYGCDSGQLTSSEQTAVAEAARGRNYSECLNGLYGCDSGQLTSSEQAAVASRKQGTPTSGVVGTSGQNASPTATATAPCAENGSCYGDLNANGVPKTVHVDGYYRKDGTYVRGYYRSAPGTNPPKTSK